MDTNPEGFAVDSSNESRLGVQSNTADQLISCSSSQSLEDLAPKEGQSEGIFDVGEERDSTSHSLDNSEPDSSTLRVGWLNGDIDGNDELLDKKWGEESKADVQEPQEGRAVTAKKNVKLELIQEALCTYTYPRADLMMEDHKPGAFLERSWVQASYSTQKLCAQPSTVRDSSLWCIS